MDHNLVNRDIQCYLLSFSLPYIILCLYTIYIYIYKGLSDSLQPTIVTSHFLRILRCTKGKKKRGAGESTGPELMGYTSDNANVGQPKKWESGFYPASFRLVLGVLFVSRLSAFTWKSGKSKKWDAAHEPECSHLYQWYRYVNDILAEHFSGTFLLDTLCYICMGYSWGKLLWNTLAWHSGLTLVLDTLAGRFSGTLLADTLAGHSWWYILVGHSCGSLQCHNLWNALTRQPGGTLLPLTLVGHSCVTLF